MFVRDEHFTKDAVKKGWMLFSCSKPNGKYISKKYNYGDFNNFVFAKKDNNLININYKSNPSDSYYKNTIMKYSGCFALFIPDKTYIRWYLTLGGIMYLKEFHL